ncbi:beta-galactosidase 6-like isoform X3 [Solanum lycopersicum]|uniref:beta-galactosidase 6-like isoform X3 n=1 Tax=Solanum lycopersicum TaxID=4081 RepID=UPI000532C2E1|nr:beta-galactosidase 6-like isoform X3 [Solanum lycopersicum]
MESKKLLLVIILSMLLVFEKGASTTVTYDHKALVIDGKRRILQSGSIHYPRTTPEIWPEIIRKAKEGGLDVIESYVFWNYHEPVKGEYYFEGRFDLVRFVKTVQEAGLYVHLRIGPYACAEWNYGGFPMWLHFIPGIKFRTTNELFKNEMKLFLAKIVDLMKDENLFATQGGPIILAQVVSFIFVMMDVFVVENEYGNVEWAYGVSGELYVKWAAETAVNLNTTVPWVMCAQEDAPDSVINTCNGFYCDRFTPNSLSKPKMWTENYVGWFLAFGYPVPFRPVEDLAFAVARFFETGGTFQNYYMYFGGTNFGRTAGGPLVATSYDYDAPIDEYGFISQPKWGHLRDLHKAIKHCEEYLVNADPIHLSLGLKLEAHVYYKSSNDCAAFLANYGNSSDANVTFNGKSYFLHAWSVSILPDCKNVIFNTAKVVSQKTTGSTAFTHNTVTIENSLESDPWGWYQEKVGIANNHSFASPRLLEQINTTKDTSDFLWYTTSINVEENIKKRKAKELQLMVGSLGHAALVFVNKKPVGFGYGNHDDASFVLSKKIHLKQGNNTVDILSMMVGLQNYGPWFDISGAGVFSVIFSDLKNSKNFSSTEWIYQTSFSPPEGRGPISLNLSSMGKGQAWVNGQHIGRYWSSYRSPSTGCSDNCDYRGAYDSWKCLKKCGQPAQVLYHVPRSWLKPEKNLLVLHEELGGDPSKISFSTRSGQTICAHVSELDPPPVDTWKTDKDQTSQEPSLQLNCEQGWTITAVNFASFGTPTGDCGAFIEGSCHWDVLSIVHQGCVGKSGCSIPITMAKLGDPCPGVQKSLAVEAFCSV